MQSVKLKMMTPADFHGREAEKESNDYEESRAIIEMINNKLSELADFSFVVGDFFVHCVTHDGKVVPAEGAVVEFSLEEGILAQWHCILRSGPIPSGYRSQCTENAKKTHNIPIGINEFILFIYLRKVDWTDVILEILFLTFQMMKTWMKNIKLKCSVIKMTVKALEIFSNSCI